MLRLQREGNAMKIPEPFWAVLLAILGVILALAVLFHPDPISSALRSSQSPATSSVAPSVPSPVIPAKTPDFPTQPSNPVPKEAPTKMSTFSAIFKDLTTFASKFEAEFAKLWAKAPQIDTVILTTLTFVAPLIETAVGLEAGAGAGNAVTAVLNTVEQDLIAAKGLVAAVGPTPSVANLINGVANDLSALLTAGRREKLYQHLEHHSGGQGTGSVGRGHPRTSCASHSNRLNGPRIQFAHNPPWP